MFCILVLWCFVLLKDGKETFGVLSYFMTFFLKTKGISFSRSLEIKTLGQLKNRRKIVANV
jgi:hypothetical protein